MGIRAAFRALVTRDIQGPTPAGMIPPRASSRRGSAIVNDDTAMRHSAVWACLTLRADLVSTFPVDCFRTIRELGVNVDTPRPPVLVNPGGERWDYVDWMWASQHDFDKVGNIIGLIAERDGNGLPSRIDLQPSSACTVIQRKGQTEPIYRIDNVIYQASQVWHERQYPVPGLPVGLSPLAFAAWSIGEFLSIQDFALSWFGGGAVPKAGMQNKSRKLDENDVTRAKQWYRDVMNNGDLLVYGSDWEYSMIQAEAAGVEWLAARSASMPDIGRFFGVPSDLIDAAISGQSITYANMTQRNLQFLIMKLGTTVAKREKNLSKLLLKPRFVKLNTDALLRMDPATQANVIRTRIDSRTMTVTEARELYNQAPLTAEQEAEFNRLFPPKTSTQPPEKVASQRALEQWMVDAAAPRSPVPIDGAWTTLEGTLDGR